LKETVQRFADQNKTLTDENIKLIEELKSIRKEKRELKNLANDKTDQIGIIQNATLRDQEHLNY